MRAPNVRVQHLLTFKLQNVAQESAGAPPPPQPSPVSGRECQLLAITGLMLYCNIGVIIGVAVNAEVPETRPFFFSARR